ncbi:hypothetical protein [Sulfitobacter sp. S190]|uniref:hypothetical protein n=1 Tax=Sulfitobacter sp. S190 TaxID=2867022 RepID=UPI0021A8AFE6|nr:hypothetical protein [Sulfitobacter sp. S190]UWR21074.1 hypothetical protein K3756_10100 [Sulfitobacter sp. S190]
MAKTPLFLHRKSYRARRMIDALRVLPFVVLILWLVPLMWPRGDAAQAGNATTMSQALSYVFVIWLLAICASALLWRRMKDPQDLDAPLRGEGDG